MVEAKLSERSKKILTWLISSPSPDAGEGFRVRFLRQQTLADLFGCSRRSIGRALKELKEARLLVDLNKRHENRCKLYQLADSSLRGAVGDLPTPRLRQAGVAIQASSGLLRVARNDGLTPEAQRQWELFEKTFRVIFDTPDLPSLYAQVTWGLGRIKDPNDLWRKTFDRLYEIPGIGYRKSIGAAK